jgi:uncharacterized membrane protein
MIDRLYEYAATFWWLGLLSIITFIGTLILIPILVARIPADYFSREQHHPDPGRHPLLRVLSLGVKNLIGVVFILSGIAMLVLPGQGIITILIGVILMDFPGKRALEQRLVRQPQVFNAINWMRSKTNRPPLNLPESDTITHQSG